MRRLLLAVFLVSSLIACGDDTKATSDAASQDTSAQLDAGAPVEASTQEDLSEDSSVVLEDASQD